ncbi:hypothetical protein LguiA_003234 [Lonicera macranthoides]
MSLQQRPLPPQIKRTTSMTGITIDMSDVDSPLPQKSIFNNPVVVATSEYDDRPIAMVSPRHRKPIIAEDNFLTTCGRCRRRLSHGHDIYMYRGDTAFCSVECREEQMKHDERKEN